MKRQVKFEGHLSLYCICSILTRNKLTGSVPDVLLQRAEARSLTLRLAIKIRSFKLLLIFFVLQNLNI